ncbi:DMT family transporter [Parerythrobacter jejuensis]|uniref:EamA family transporter n=1 Tax=Parerythrobacter jejuensis TaxID=795812 RepID=A0A845AS43_9SPHN|nr:DMT family transporter [Parerythrobacter jejuensis]MXP31765.1 EamA family transporter [Parerythrobacter jejuensis]
MDGSVARPRPFLALGLRLVTALSLATMAMLVKLGEQRGAHLLEMIFWRQFLTFLVIGGLLAVTGRLVQIRTKRFGAHARRAIYGITGMVFVYGAVILLPLAEATTISFTTPMFAVILALVLFREKIGFYRWSAVIVGFAGVAIVMQPWGSDAVDPLGVAVGLVAAFMVALISFQIQDLNKTETPYGIIFWFTALTTPLAALALPFVLSAHDPMTWLVILAVAGTGALAQVLLTTSLRFGSAATIIVMDYTALIWATTYGWTVFERVPPATLWIGAPLIIVSGLIVAWREHRLKKT